MITAPALAEGNVATSGRNVALIVHVPPTATVDGQSLVCVKLPAIVMKVMLSSAVPLLVITTVWTPVLALNASVVGANVTLGALVVVVVTVVVVNVSGVDPPPQAASTRASEMRTPASCPKPT